MSYTVEVHRLKSRKSAIKTYKAPTGHVSCRRRKPSSKPRFPVLRSIVPNKMTSTVSARHM